ncbi:MAG TPA: glycoside hydrolase family 57 protein [Vicinamibacterales bacterium]|nr:glycoside hydrolase family 57 protein [Vicinamibacterales bacterium]
MTRVALLWHMHQPYYEDLVTREHFLPWVRLHALKDYYGMAALLREFPGVRVTFNLVPSMLAQLEAFAEGRARDPYLDLSLKPTEDLSEPDVVFMLKNFFHAQRHRMIYVYPRYRELLEQRDRGRFSVADLRDLQVWHKLAWIDPFYLAGDARVRGLLDKQRHFSEDDKQVLRGVELELLNRVIPEYRDGIARGQIEVSTSPFYHPILPLLCDTDIYLRTHPESPMPRRRFHRPEDALEQLQRAAVYHERLFGRRPIGLWPSEGSVSDAMVPLAAQTGFQWMATDEEILAKSLGIRFARDVAGHLDQPERLYTAYRVNAGVNSGGAAVNCLFRDHALSDLIGFVYSGWEASAAAGDFVARLVEAGRRYRAKTGGEAVIPIILDGENAWEHFEGGGRPFLRALYGALQSHPELATVTMAQACEGQRQTIHGIFPGSWIDANFYIWIGHADDRRGWDQVAAARQMLDEHVGGDQTSREAAREEILIAEGSDWFWWYGDDHSSDHDAEFDDLFRRHLRNAYQLLGQPVPDDLFVSNITTAAPSDVVRPPIGWLAPRVDGRDSSYFEWLHAGVFEVQRTAGAMHQIDVAPAVIERVRFGFSPDTFCVRFDGPGAMDEQLQAGREVTLAFLRPEGVKITARLGSDNGCYVNHDLVGAAVGQALELVVPLSVLGVGPGGLLSFSVVVSERGPRGITAIERHPGVHPIDVQVPGPDFDATHWCA